jgi:hypothetical protein
VSIAPSGVLCSALHAYHYASKQKKKVRPRPTLSIVPVHVASNQLPTSAETVVQNSTSTAVPDDRSLPEASADTRTSDNSLRVDTPASGASIGRKRAFSDPGEVKRPSTAGTDYPEEHVTMTILSNNNQNLQFGEVQQIQQKHDQDLYTPPLVQSVYMPTQVPEGYVAMQHPIDNGIGYQAYGYPMYAQVRNQKSRVAVHQLTTLPATCSRVCCRTICIRMGWISVLCRSAQHGEVIWRAKIWITS